MVDTPDGYALSTDAIQHLARCLKSETALHDRLRMSLLIALSATTVDNDYVMEDVLNATPEAISHVAVFLATRHEQKDPTVH